VGTGVGWGVKGSVWASWFSKLTMDENGSEGGAAKELSVEREMTSLDRARPSVPSPSTRPRSLQRPERAGVGSDVRQVPQSGRRPAWPLDPPLARHRRFWPSNGVGHAFPAPRSSPAGPGTRGQVKGTGWCPDRLGRRRTPAGGVGHGDINRLHGTR